MNKLKTLTIEDIGTPLTEDVRLMVRDNTNQKDWELACKQVDKDYPKLGAKWTTIREVLHLHNGGTTGKKFTKRTAITLDVIIQMAKENIKIKKDLAVKQLGIIEAMEKKALK